VTTHSRPTSRDREDFDWDAEREVDFRRWWDGLVARWWLPLLGLVVGAIIGYAISLGGGQVYKASTTIYLGQPYSASGNIQLQSLQTNPSTVRQIVTSPASIAAAAQVSGMKTSALRGHISVSGVTGNIARLGQTPLVTITVQGARRDPLKRAANALAQHVINRVGGYAARKIQNFRALIVADEKQENAIAEQIEQAEKAARSAITPTDKLVATVLITTAQQRLSTIQQDRLQNSQLLTQAQLIEQPRVVTPAGTQKVTARSRRNSVVVAAVIGLIVGIVAALVTEAVAGRVERRRSV
jgi:capsular polysaccharide biosynthesis protein